MSDRLQPGLHLDADALNAFAEGALPAHERSQALAHLAECAYCREIVFLTQQTAPLAAPAPAPVWSRWLNSVPMLGIGIGAAALAGAALIFITLRLHPNTAPSLATRAPETMPPTAPAAPAAPAKPQPLVSQHPAPRGVAKPLPKLEPPLLAAAPPTPPRPMVAGRSFMGMGMGMSTGTAGGIDRGATVGGPITGRSMAMSSSQGDAAPQAVFGGSGQPLAAAPRPAAVTLGSGSPAPSAAPAPPPTAASVTTADALAALPAAAQTVTVQSTPALDAEPVHLANGLTMDAAAHKRASQAPLTSPAELPSKLPAAASVSSAARTLAADTAGALFLSVDAGRHWQPVAAAWPGKVAQLRLAPAPSVFQLLTTTGDVWLSPDGLHWQPQ